MAQSYPVGQAPWEVSSDPQSYPVGSAPWETDAPAGDVSTKNTQPEPANANGKLARSLGIGALNLVVNNPISHALTSLSAMPVQGLAKVMGQPDPYKNMAASPILPGGIDITSSDQSLGKYAEEELGNAATVGSLFVPAGAAADVVTGGAGLLGATGRVAANTLLGAGQGAAGAMQQGEDWTGIKSGAKIGAVTGGIFSGTGEAGSALINKWAAGAGDIQLTAMKDKLKTLGNNFAKNSTNTTDPITTLKQQGLIKDLKVIDGKVNTDKLTNPQNMGSLDQMIQEQKDAGVVAAENIPGVAKLDDFKTAVIDTIKKDPYLKQSGKIGKTVASVESMFADYKESYGASMPFKEMNGVRMQMNKTWDPETWDAQRAVGDTARSILYSKPGIGAALKSAMKNEGELLAAKDFVLKLNQHAVKGGLMGKYIADAVGATVGASAGAPIPVVGPIGGAVAGAWATNKAANLLQGRYFNPALAAPAQKAASFMPALSTAKKIGQATLIPSLVGNGGTK